MPFTYLLIWILKQFVVARLLQSLNIFLFFYDALPFLICFGFVLQGLHPRIIAEGFEAAKEKALAVLEEVKVSQEMDRETLINVARTSLRTKVHTELADLLTEVSKQIFPLIHQSYVDATVEPKVFVADISVLHTKHEELILS